MSVMTITDEKQLEEQIAKKPALLLIEFGQPGKDEKGYDNESARTAGFIDSLSIEYSGKAVMLRVPHDSGGDIWKKYAITSVPTVLILHYGEQKFREGHHLLPWYRATLSDLLSKPQSL